MDKFVGLVLDLGFNAFEAVVHLSFLVHLLTELAPALGTRVMGHAVVGTVRTIVTVSCPPALASLTLTRYWRVEPTMAPVRSIDSNSGSFEAVEIVTV